MGLQNWARMAGATAILAGLAGCMDISLDVEVLGEETARGTMTTAMAPDIYAMMQAQAEEGEDFCEGGEIIETPDSVSCVVVQEGSFEQLRFNEDGEDEGIVIEDLGGGQVKVGFPTGELAEDIADQAGGADSDPQLEAMIASMFEGHAITFVISGGEIVESNMTIAADGQSASYEIPFNALLGGTADLPDELYAIVQK